MKSLLYGSALLALAYQALAQTNDPLDQWQSYDPLPSNFLGSVAFLNGQFWGVGDGTVWASQDGTNWACSGLLPMDGPFAIAYGNGTYVVVGIVQTVAGMNYSGGLIATSPDGAAWTAQQGPLGYAIGNGPAGLWLPIFSPGASPIAFGNGVFVVWVELEDGTVAVLTSPDGIQWAIHEFGDTALVKDITFGNGIFAALASDASGNYRLITSADGVLWTPHPSPVGPVPCLGYGGGSFIVLGGGSTVDAVATSTNCAAWTTNTVSWPFRDSPWDVAYGNGLFVAACSGGGVAVSANGIAWADSGFAALSDVMGVCYGKGAFVAVGPGPPAVSTDGVRWDQPAPVADLWINGVVYARDRFVAVGCEGLWSPYNGVGVIFGSADGMHWSVAHPVVEGLMSVAYGNSLFVAAGGSNVVTSADGISWAPQALGGAASIQSVAYGEGQFVAVGGAILTSTDGVHWLQRNPGTNVGLAQVVYGNGAFVALLDAPGGAVLASPDGVAWTLQSSGTTDQLLGLCYGQGVFLAVGNQTVLTSTDGVHWSAPGSSPPWSGEVVGPAYVHGMFAVCSGGGFFTSTNTVDWVLHDTGCGCRLTGLAFGGATLVGVGESGRVVQSGTMTSWPMRLAPLPWRGTGPFQITVAGPANHNWEIDASSDLFGWAPLANLWSTNGVITLTDPGAPHQARQFYRGEWW